ncbi:OmpA family protein [Stenotrophomonas sp.]|uniref:OmpA family protein n=1 Tax=Stenotrophomonas sp. TaxID=69392 RepID=UPI002D64FEDD|nr:OmpA family protein [Stenotrophomonas sp.]HYQ25189.1 OmpA family protein [Stenotrophomonas sp.]
MSAYDRFVEDAAIRLELGHRARWVIDVLQAWIATRPGGLEGLQQQFEDAGLAARFHSWRQPAQVPLPIVASELERALGAPTLAVIAQRSDMSPGAFRVVACQLLPGVVGLMSAAAVSQQAAPAAPPAPGAAFRRMAGVVPSHAMYGMALRSLLWMLAAATVLILTTLLLLKARTPLWTSQALSHDHTSRVVLQQDGMRLQVEGSLPNESDRRRLWSALKAVHGQQNLSGSIALDPRAEPPRWLDRLINDLPHLQGDGLRLEFDGPQLRIVTTGMADAQRLAISHRLRQDFPALQMQGLWGPGLAALARLPASAGSGERVAALNLTRLKFHMGSSELTGDSLETLDAVATALRQAPAGTRVEVAAHTDSHGDAHSNQQLSQQRADAVVKALQERGAPAAMLVPVGYGHDQPVADNRSDAGRAQNRRIAYQLLE